MNITTSDPSQRQPAITAAMPNEAEMRDVELSGVDDGDPKIATGSGNGRGTARPTSTTDPMTAEENLTSHDANAKGNTHVVINGIGLANDSASKSDETLIPIVPAVPTASTQSPPLPVRENGDLPRSESQTPQHQHVQQIPPPPSPSLFVTPEKEKRHLHELQSAKAAADSIKIDKEVAQLNEHILGASSKALQRLLREHWRNFLFQDASLNHLSFILRALLKNTSVEVMNHVGDTLVFKDRLLDLASNSEAVIQKALHNASIPELLACLPPQELDKVVSHRLKTAPAKTLITWLAENDRLGYQMDDIIEDGETVMPNVPHPPSRDVEMTNGGPVNGFQHSPRTDSPSNGFTSGTSPTNGQPLMPHAFSDNPVIATQERERHAEYLRLRGLEHYQWQQYSTTPGAQRMYCPNCRSHFFDVSGFNYHISKKVCHKEPNGFKFSCHRCYQGFSTKQGQEYHCKKEVCAGNDGPPLEAPPGPSSVSTPLHPSMVQQNSSGPVPLSAPTVQSNYPMQTGPGPGPAPVLQSQVPVHQPAVAIPRPSLHTPGKREPPSDVRQSPSQLTPEKLAALQQELQDEDDKYATLRAAAQALPVASERDARLVSLKNGNASKKSQIRKKYGVSLRLREKDKAAARNAVSIAAPPPNPRLNASSYMASLPTPTSSAGLTAPTTGFSPINAAQRNGPSPLNGLPYGPPPSSLSQRPPMTNGPLRHAQADQPSGSGFGMLVNNTHPRYAPHNQMTTSTYAEQQRNAKRRRSEDDDDGRQSFRPSFYSSHSNTPSSTAPPRPSRMSMMELSSEDAANKYPKKSLAPGQSQVSGPNSNSPAGSPFEISSTAPVRRKSGTATRNEDTPMTDVSTRTRPEPVYISSEDETENAPAPAPPRPASSRGVLPSIENISAPDSRRVSLGNPGMLARRTSAPRRGSSLRGSSIRRAETTEDDDGSSRSSTAAQTEPSEDFKYKARTFAEQARIAEEFAKKYGKGGLRD